MAIVYHEVPERPYDSFTLCQALEGYVGLLKDQNSRKDIEKRHVVYCVQLCLNRSLNIKADQYHPPAKRQ